MPSRSTTICLAAAAIAGAIAAPGVAAEPTLVAPSVEAIPARPLIARSRLGRELNLDLVVKNTTGRPLELVTVRAAVFDPSGAVTRRLEVNDNGIAPGIETLPNRRVGPGEARTVFNPFHTFAADVPLDRVDFELVFRDGEGRDVVSRLSVRPVEYRTKTRLRLPLDGRMLVWDGHDHLSHHRRFDLAHPVVQGLGWTGNSGRYSFDLVLTDQAGRMTRGEGKADADYLGAGQPVLAPAAGTVVRAMNDAVRSKDGLDLKAVKANSLVIFGNYVVIDHGNGEFSQLGHLQQGSVTVRVGDKVAAGQPVARVGATGSSLFPHLHYQLVSAPDAASEGLPVEFEDFTDVLGAKTAHVARGTIDTGDIVERGGR